MPSKSRPDPIIPDHDVLRKIGGGAYGEVWLARGVTGALRAVKVVWREDFEDERGFEREFEGILKFEPISRDHPGLVNILHVGRSPDGVSFYYYVMELGDDVRTGQTINPIEYEPRTLRADAKQAISPQLELAVCIDVGLRLAEALNHLHEQGLAHRDVKPSNVIFVNGKAKLADIGLVAARGQRTFVGTEGFVPPEGPGSAQADVYSLGKVLYEIATGKDRLDFPELPELAPVDKKRWQGLNQIICDICEPRISKRKIVTAAGLADALRRLQRGKRRRRSSAAAWLTGVVLVGFSGWAGWEVAKSNGFDVTWHKPSEPPESRVGMIRIFTSPQDADVYDASGVWVGTTPTEILSAEVGKEVTFSIRKKGYRPLVLKEFVPPVALEQPFPLSGELQIYAPPEVGELWRDHMGDRFLPVGKEHISAGYVTEAAWKQFLDVSKRSIHAVEFLDFSEHGEPVKVVLASAEERIAFCDWFRVKAIEYGYLTSDHEVIPAPELSFQDPGLSERAIKEELRPFKLIVRKIAFGGIMLTTMPPGADVYLSGTMVGNTGSPLSIPQVKPGNVELLLVIEGYKPLTEQVTVKAGETVPLHYTLEENQGVVFGKKWENGIGMHFVPVGPDLMASIWETRVQDYDLYVRESGTLPPRVPDFPQGPDHPVVYVSRDDAKAFSLWLTDRERNEERIAVTHEYRLPTDLEWSTLWGIQEEVGLGPGWRDSRKQKIFPWGTSWPPTEQFGNYADGSAAKSVGIMSGRTIPGYEDGFQNTAPVGSFAPNAYGIYDLSGNVHEWVEDNYTQLAIRQPLGVLRGGGWNTYQREDLYIGFRNAVPADFRDNIYGFRVVLAKVPEKDLSPPVPSVPFSPIPNYELLPSDG